MYCHICKCLACDQCFLVCEDLDMCKHCTAALGQKGQTEESYLIEAAI